MIPPNEKCKIFEIMIIHYKFLCFLGPVNRLYLVSSLSCICRHTAKKKVPKHAICCDPLTKILVVRDVGIS